jgi:hypothetical protein
MPEAAPEPSTPPATATRWGMVLRSMAPVLAYYVADWAWGLRPAIIASTLWSMGEVVVHLIQKQPLDSLFKFTAVTTFLFGMVDLLCTSPWLFSYEPVVTNAVTAGFLVVLARGSLGPLLEQVYQARPDLRGDDGVVTRLRVAVWMMVAFTVAKVPLYLWMAWKLPVESAMNARVMVGNVSLVLMLVAVRFGLEPVLRAAQRLGWIAAEETR